MNDVTQKAKFGKNSPGQNNEISTLMNERLFCKGGDWFLVCYPRRQKSNGTILARLDSSIERWLLLSRSVAVNEPPFGL